MWLWKASSQGTPPSDASSSVASPDLNSFPEKPEPDDAMSSTEEDSTEQDSTEQESTDEESSEQESTEEESTEQESTNSSIESICSEESSDDSSSPINLPNPSPSYVPKPARVISLVSVVVVSDGDFPECFTVYGDADALRSTNDSWNGAMVDVHDIPDDLADIYSIIPALHRYMPHRDRLGKRRRSSPIGAWPRPEKHQAEPVVLDNVYHIYIDIGM